MQGKRGIHFILAAALALGLAAPASAARIKDVAKIAGLSDLQISGFGLVVGLRNTGDGPRTLFTTRAMANMLRNSGVDVPGDQIRVRNAAAVMVTAKLPPFLKKGGRIDVSISSLGDAKSLEGGTLLLTPLAGVDGKIYALAQGAVGVGGFNVESMSGLATIQKNHTLTGLVPNGAIVQREMLDQVMPENTILYSLHNPDLSSAVYMANAINTHFGDKIAYPQNSATVSVLVPADWSDKSIDFMSVVENLDFAPSVAARVVLNEKTGTVVAGGEVSISPVAVSHGNITISINSTQETATTAGAAAGPAGGGIALTSQTKTSDQAAVREQRNEMKVLPAVNNVSELAGALNSLGVSPRDVISIFQSIKQAGALHAELVIM